MKKRKNNRISKKVLSQIKKNKVKMKPCCYHCFKKCFFLFLSTLSFALAITIASFVFFYLSHFKTHLLIFSHPSLTIQSLPYVLIILAVLSIYFSAKFYRMSRHLCRHENWLLIGSLTFGAMIIAASFSSAKMEKKIRIACEKNNFYQKAITTPQKFWSKPKKGTLSGMILKIQGGNEFFVQDWNGKVWKVNHSKKGSPKILQKDTPRNLKKYRAIRMAGQQEEKQTFTSWAIWQW